ncbi:MAG: ribonuclease Z [candidate division Zixibacteria bacterium]|nr:ribonuclease Z [candidate division Zixibacteria bacterium]
MPENSFTILGSSSGMPQADRACAGYLLNVGNDLTLIDCGGGVTSSFLRCGFDPLDVDRVFISHTHPDHCCELPLFIQMVYLAGRTRPLDIYLPEEFVEPFGAYLTAVYIIPEKLPFDLSLHGYTDGFTFSDGFSLRAIGNRHLAGYAEYVGNLQLANKMQCHCFRIEVPASLGKSAKGLFYSADVRDFDDLKPHLNNVDYAVLELTHIDLEQFFDFAPTASVGEFIISHLGDVNETATVEQVAAKTGLGNLTIAHDGTALAL